MDSGLLLRTVLGELSTPAFLAGFNARRSRLTVHVPAGHDLATLRMQAERAAEQAGAAVTVCVRAHRLRKLAHPRSLEHWLARFDIDEVAYDPTMIMSRARGLIAAAQLCRALFGRVVGGLFFDPNRRTLFVLRRGTTDGASSNLGLRIQAALDQGYEQALARLGHDRTGRGWTDVQVVAALPGGSAMIPVDRRSASLRLGLRRAARRWFAPIAVALALTGAALPAAAKVGTDNFGPTAVSAQSMKGMTAGEFGVLAGLSVFADDAQRYELDAFASMGLYRYFGEGAFAGTGKFIHIARIRRTDCAHEPARIRARDPDCVGTLPARPREPKNIGQVPGGTPGS